MCGIFAILHRGTPVSRDAVSRALASLRHRGPDDSGTWHDPHADAVLGQTRLSIQDTSSAGHQPMHSAGGRFVLVFNGEIYNHRDLRSELDQAVAMQGASIAWRGHSDTETLLACIEHWGLDRAIERATGMFALALWDRERQQISLVRDRAGEKPLYYGRVGSVFVVASEARTFGTIAGSAPEIDRRSVGLMMRFGAIPAPYSIYQGISKLEPGHRVTIGIDTAARGDLPASQPYWQASVLAREYASRQLSFGSAREATDALHECLGAAVRRQLISDVPLGAFLSGGVDSSIVVALMQAEARGSSGDPVRTFSIGFHERDYNEAQHAKAVAAHLQTRHTELYVSEAECLSLVPKLATIYDEPFADSSQIGVCLVSRMAREHVTVALTGDGGDEVFGGYNRYTRAASLWHRMNRMPAALRQRIGKVLGHMPSLALERSASSISSILPDRMKLPRLGDRLEKLAGMLGSEDAPHMYLSLVEYWDQQEIMLDPVGDSESLGLAWPDLPTLEEQMMLLDLTFVLPTDMLTKVDRAAMAVSLETRLPFLDPAVMEFAWRLPLKYKVHNGQGKWLVRQLLYRFVPQELVDRPKMGFESPVARWLRGPLRDWAEALIDERRLREQGYFNANALRRCWKDHLAGRRDNSGPLWAAISFQSWLEQHDKPVPALPV